VIGFLMLFQDFSIPLSTPTMGTIDTRSVIQDEKHSQTQSLNTTTISPTTLPATAPMVVDSASLSTTPPPKPEYERAKVLDRKATILVQLSGEMANNLHHIAHGIGLQLMAKEEFNIDCNVVLRHQEAPKWKSARDKIQQCFPNLTGWDFAEGNNKKIFQERWNLQSSWLQERADELQGLINSQDLSEIRKGLQILSEQILTDPDRPWVDEGRSSIRIPFLFSETLDVFPMIDRYFDPISDLFVFNDTTCCRQIPKSEDIVFHFRNYESEMPERRAYEMGFAELSPSKVATEIFPHLQPGNDKDHVQITTRIFNQRARNYVEALDGHGIHSSIIIDQSSLEDFCFLKETKRELVGNARSTFVQWAAFLGTVSKARLYHVDNRGLRDRHPDFWKRFTYNFTHPRLCDRVVFELYLADP